MKSRAIEVLAFLAFFVGMPLAIVVIERVVNSEQQTTTQQVESAKDDKVDDTESFHGYTCTSDCSGHQAGYDWAEEHDICDPDYDNGNSESFNEGVIAYAYDNCYYSDGDDPI